MDGGGIVVHSTESSDDESHLFAFEMEGAQSYFVGRRGLEVRHRGEVDDASIESAP